MDPAACAPAETNQSIDDLIARRRPNFSLEQPFYTDPAIFQRDLERVHYRNWLMAGHVSRLPESGSYFLYEIGSESLIITRDRDNQIHGLWNVCRHRGSRVCRESEGRSNSLACPYHAWTYAPDGRLLGAPAMPEDFDKGAFGLKRCAVRVFHGIIFVYLGPDGPPDIEPVLADIDPFVLPYQLDKARLAARMTWEIAANWKLVVENFAECYHCGPAHPEYCAAMDHALVDGTNSPSRAEDFARQTAEWEAQAKSLNHYVGSVAARAETPHCAGRMPIGSGRLSQSRDGSALAPVMGSFQKNDGGYTSFRIYPGSYFLAPCDHAVLCVFTPLAVNRTLQEMLWLVAPEAEAGRDYQVDDVTWLWRVTTDQDLQIIEDNQRGVSSRAYEPGPYSMAEPGPERFVRWYLDQLK